MVLSFNAASIVNVLESFVLPPWVASLQKIHIIFKEMPLLLCIFTYIIVLPWHALDKLLLGKVVQPPRVDGVHALHRPDGSKCPTVGTCTLVLNWRHLAPPGPANK